jgi:hypothetical protein
MHSFKSNRGSVLIVALIFSAILAISLTSYLKLSLNAANLAHRSFYLNAAQNLVDTGMEKALWSLNHEVALTPNHWSTGGFSAHPTIANSYCGTFPTSGEYTFAGNVTGRVKVWVGDYNATEERWHLVSEATITLANGSTIKKIAEAYTQQLSYSGGGMVTRNGIKFNGNVVVDSWISRPTATQDIKYSNDDSNPSTFTARSFATIATPKTVALQNADVFGYASIGTRNLTVTPLGLDCGPNGRLRGVPLNTVDDFRDITSPGIDASRVTCDFTASFPDVMVPQNTGTSIPAITGSYTAPTGTHTYYLSGITLNGNGADLVIPVDADITLFVYGNVTLGGGGKIIVNADTDQTQQTRLTMYVDGNVTITGNGGIVNGTETVGAVKGIPNNPDRFTLLGLRTEAQGLAIGMHDWKVQGTSHLSAVIYAPNANVEVNGTGDTFGSVVGNYVDMKGSGNFHQDESLKKKRTSGYWMLSKWRELTTAAERGVYATNVTF